MSRILLRFNTKFEEDKKRRTWRVLVDGIEKLASKVYINVTSETITEDVAPGVTKYHVLCHGNVTWDEDEVTIT